jgi:hypothetical protein
MKKTVGFVSKWPSLVYVKRIFWRVLFDHPVTVGNMSTKPPVASS